MSEWSLTSILSVLHDDVEQSLTAARAVLQHPPTKGSASEKVWLQLLQKYLPKRYQVESAHVVDSTGAFSDQIDVVVFDRQYSPFILTFQDSLIIPAESVYAVFEAKQTANIATVDYAQSKVASVRRLFRSSLPIPHAGGTYPPKPLSPIIGGLLTLESEWNPALGDSLRQALSTDDAESRLDMGCIAAHGFFSCGSDGCYTLHKQSKSATSFLFELIARLQSLGTVPMIDVRGYARWLTDSDS